MGIHEDAFKGVLYKLEGYTDVEINSIETIDIDGDPLRVTPLAAACRGGWPNVVQLLLKNGALPNQEVDEQTAIYFTIISNVSSKKQSTIIEELIKAKADINLPCDENSNTPLMVALIGSPYERIIRLLVAKGAAVDGVTNSKNETPRTLAKKRKMESLLGKETDIDAMTKQQVVDLVVGLVQVVIAYANDLTATQVLGGAVKQAYGMTGVNRSDILKEIPKPLTTDQLTSSVADYATKKNLTAFFPKDDNKFFEELAKKAVALSNDPSTDLGKPENIARLTTLSLYETVLYLDDSGSMATTDSGRIMNRYQILGELVKRITSIATKIVPDDIASVQLRFINSNHAQRHGANDILDAVNKNFSQGGTQIGTNLREKVLKPIVYDMIARKSNTNPIPLRRPVLVCIITDGAPNSEDPSEMQKEILRCRDKLRKAGFEDDAVMFCISQIGQATEATQFLKGLQNEAGIEQTTYISSDRLDDMFQGMKKNERELEVWLLKLLTKPLFERDAE